MPNNHGGRRPGAGCKNRTGLRGHACRQKLDRLRPLHVVLRLRKGLPSFKKKETFLILRSAVKKSRKKGLAIVHFSILSNHIHLLVESDDHLYLARSVQSLAVSFAKKLNLALKRTGSVFRDRYFSRIIRGVREMRTALRYVIANQALHDRRDSGGLSPFEINMDPFSSALRFNGWKDLGERPTLVYFDRWSIKVLEDWMSEILTPPRTWLLRDGWRV